MKIVIENCRISIRPALSFIRGCSLSTVRGVRKIIRNNGYWDAEIKDTSKVSEKLVLEVTKEAWDTYQAWCGTEKKFAVRMLLLDEASKSFKEENKLLDYLIQNGILNLAIEPEHDCRIIGIV